MDFSLRILTRNLSLFNSVACPVETSYDKTSSKCVLCGKGSYQDKEGQASCIECDEGKSTDNLGGASSEECVKG